MDKMQWKYFKRNNLKLIWRNATISWCHTLPWNLPLINFLKKFKTGQYLHYLLYKLRFMLVRKPIMPCVEYVLTTKCTMKCKHCNSFMPYYTEKTQYAKTTFEEFKKDIDTLLQAVDYIDYFGFVGGEPLLCKDLDKMVVYACSQKKLHHIFIATNCTIMPTESLLKAMQNKKLAVQLSDYRDVKFKNNVSVKYDEYKQLLSKYNILYSHPEEDGDRMTFQSMPELYPDTQNSQKLVKMFDNCWGQYCQMLCEGVLTQCTLSVFIYRTKELSAGIKKEVVNIRENKTARELTQDIIKFYAKPYSAFCHYCHSDNIKYGLPCGEQIEK